MTDEEIKIKMIDIMKKEEIINKNKENNNIKKRILIKIILLNHRVKYKLIKKLTIKKKEVNKIITNLMINKIRDKLKK
jgi:hypothetical protein